MKKLIISAVLLTGLLASTSAQAAWTDEVQALLNNGQLSGINKIAAANPNIHGELALFLMRAAQTKLPGDPDTASRIFALAGSFVGEIPMGESPKAVTIIRDMVDKAQETKMQQSYCATALSVLGTALSMSGQPNIVSSSANLQSTILAAANLTLDGNPQCDATQLRDTVSLAEQTGSRPDNRDPKRRKPPITDPEKKEDPSKE